MLDVNNQSSIWMVARWFLPLKAILLLSLLATASFAEPIEPPPDDFVLVRRVIDARYFDVDSAFASPRNGQSGKGGTNWSGASLRSSLSLSEALSSDISREVPVLSNDAISNVVLREYGFGQRNSAESYAAIESKILELNGLEKPEEIKVGSRLKIPALPRMALEKPSRFNQNNAIPISSVYPALRDVVSYKSFNPKAMAFTERPANSSAMRDGAPLTVQYMWLPRDSVEKDSYLAWGEGAAEVQAESLVVTLDSAGGGGNALGSFPSQSEREIISRRLSSQPNQESVLIVLDDGWPSDEAYRNSVEFLSTALQRINKKFLYPIGVSGEFALSRQMTSFPKEKFHARSIEKSLSVLTDMEPNKDWQNNRVKVVYFPLSIAQKNSKPILEELITLRLIDDFMLDARGDFAPPVDDVNRLRKTAKEIVSRLPGDIGISNLKTDKAIIESVLIFADLYATATGNPYVVNFSWTTPKLRNKFTSFDFNRGILVAAAGNSSSADCPKCRPYLAYKEECTSCAHNAASQEMWFAARSVESQDVIAVMNTTREGALQCRSSIVNSKRIDPFVFSFDGLVSADICGTSFAAPRVAWLVAAKLAYIDPHTLDAPGPERGWQLRQIIRQARVGGVDKGDQYNLDVGKLFSN
ncbi:hypothetical protein [Pseudomonas sp. BMS12]|uniref:hypothetical protein n=1 Tax=Pseudomonas sp. BMS12 TaxID=1796033 RepID=UPI000A3F1DFB|nr:hypothetical protein [Pseudomonas sp. BMS12]